jgi:rhodanese-related sulfurtransferase
VKEEIMNEFIDLKELTRGIDSGSLTLVEALPEPHYARGHLPGAVVLPLDGLANNAARVLPEKRAAIVVYCSGPTCANSDTAGRALRALGYEHVRVFKGGKAEWTEAGHSLEVV